MSSYQPYDNYGWGEAANWAKTHPAVAPGPAPPPVPPPAAPDYSSLYQTAMNAPGYQQALGAANAANVGYGTDRAGQIQSLLTQFGEVPGGFQDKYGDIDATTRSAIDQSTTSGLSLVARMKQARDEAQRTMLRGLAAKGLRRSGARGYGLRKQQLSYDQARTDAINKLLAGTGGVYSNYAQNVYNANSGLAGALQSSINDVAPFWTQPAGGGGGGGGGFGGSGQYAGGALYQTPTENPANNPIFWFK